MSVIGEVIQGYYDRTTTTNPGHYDRSHERGENIILLVSMIVDNDSNYDSSFA